MHDALFAGTVDKGLCIVLTLVTGAALFAAEACANETERPPVTDQLGNEPAPGGAAGSSTPSGDNQQPSGGDNGGNTDGNPNGAIPPAGTTPTQPGTGAGTTTSTGGLGTTSTGGLGTTTSGGVGSTSGSTSGGTGTSGGVFGSTASSTGG